MSKNFTTRVELHNASWQDYTKLHAEMAAEGFSHTIRGNDGVVYELPTAEYVIQGNYTIEQITDKAKRAASRTQKSYAVFVTEAVQWMWYGLQKAAKVA